MAKHAKGKRSAASGSSVRGAMIRPAAQGFSTMPKKAREMGRFTEACTTSGILIRDTSTGRLYRDTYEEEQRNRRKAASNARFYAHATRR